MTLKTSLRKYFQQLRASIPNTRRFEAAKYIFEQVQQLSTSRIIISFISFRLEIDLLQINQWLISQKRLALPKIVGDHFEIYFTEDLHHQVQITPSGFHEPIPHLCQSIELSEVDAILVPGLAFDSDNYRLGYGKGCYDRFLLNIDPSIKSIGIGFREQKSMTLLPRDPWDIPVHQLWLG